MLCGLSSIPNGKYRPSICLAFMPSSSELMEELSEKRRDRRRRTMLGGLKITNCAQFHTTTRRGNELLMRIMILLPPICNS